MSAIVLTRLRDQSIRCSLHKMIYQLTLVLIQLKSTNPQETPSTDRNTNVLINCYIKGCAEFTGGLGALA